MIQTEGDNIRAERERERENEADIIRVSSSGCKYCGSKLINGKCATCNNSDFYAKSIAPRACVVCGGIIRPAADKMSGDWWMLASHKQIWRCDWCRFVGTFSDFCDEVDRQALPEAELVL